MASFKVTHPERVVYAEGNITKQDVADYYAAVARWLLPELANRPLSVVRCPHGAEGQCFFQKHHADTLGAHVPAVKLTEKDGDPAEYIYVDSIEGVLELVQMNTLEFHPWGARVDDPDKPDRLIFDLDPAEGVEWKTVAAAARDIRDVLLGAGMESFVRTSGGKGLHVVAPFQRGPSWGEVKTFCESVADALVTKRPARYIAEASKAKREGLIFIDWLRNTRGATSVTGWSLRARAGAPVAMPVRWEEIGRLKTGGAFGLKRALKRARDLREDPWEGMAVSRQVLGELL
ncbi:bifunctional non-homologous end joining protein LigD [Luteibacter rhizovicinus]|uniref:Bifunctional non-homologous end joining protein LigD n=1 Tax=Luteibacter rhizovicinus TaxID=242606 RepID=A0A4R3YNQ3_9GAMM|nr:non-homologous end-joining DNA ligase [Luteibacter rhizovicinus]TCV93882.1 bifunctional non-homologous end joining protein LigD [Luteibacter rhizovicinus]